MPRCCIATNSTLPLTRERYSDCCDEPVPDGLWLALPLPILRQGSCAKIQAFPVGLEFSCVVARYRRSHAGKVYRRRFVSARLAAALLADGAPCFAICACPALVIKRDCSYISIHFSLEIAEISLPIASSGKSSGDSK